MVKHFMANVGSLVEDTVGAFIEKFDEAPELGEGQEKETFVWYRMTIPEGLSGDGSRFHLYLRKGTSDRLVLFFSGGGVAWNEYTAARPVTGARTAAGTPNYYWNNLRPFTQIMNINTGITENDPHNPFFNWNFVVIPYSTGDFHVGDRDFPYQDTEGKEAVLHFHGKKNVCASLAVAKKHFPSPEELLIAGDSAGAFAVPAWAGPIADAYYPACRDITLLSDSGLLLSDRWKAIAKEVWGTDSRLYDQIQGQNLTADWYRGLLKGHKGRFRLLYASSTHDYLLSAFYNDMTNKVYATDESVRGEFFLQLKGMIKDLLSIDPSFSFFINKWANPLFTMAQRGTIHTVVRQPYFFLENDAEGAHLPGRQTRARVSMADWLMDAIHGTTYDVGTGLLFS